MPGERILVLGGTAEARALAAVQAAFGLPIEALIDMGDFVGGMLKYLRDHPVGRVTVAGGFGKMTKMAQGAMDLHSGRSQVDFDWLAGRVAALGGEAVMVEAVRRANSALEVEKLAHGAGLPLAADVAAAAREQGLRILRGAAVALDTLVVDRQGQVIGRAG